MPALYNLAAADLLAEGFSLIGASPTKLSADALRNSLEKGLREFANRPLDLAIAEKLLESVSHVHGGAEDPQTYEALQEELERVERTRPTQGNRLLYCATPPAVFAPIGCQLGRTGLAREQSEA